jgi:Inosine-uridine preferring nucleoside hydrolase
VVDGNVSASQGIKNVQTLVAMTGKTDSVKIFKGADAPIVPGVFEKETWPGHGHDGLGNVTMQEGFYVSKTALPMTFDEMFNVLNTHAIIVYNTMIHNVMVTVIRNSTYKELLMFALTQNQLPLRW